MRLDTSKVEVKDMVSFGDVIVITHKGMSDKDAYLICKLDNDVVGVSLGGLGILLGGTYYTIQDLMKDLNAEPLIERVSIYPYTEFILFLDKK
jgi:hypothetical protein